MIPQLLSRVAIVDRDETWRERCASALRSVGVSALTFPTAHSFLYELETLYVGMLVLSADIPDVPLLTVLSLLETPRSTMPVLVVSDYGDVTNAVAAMRAGAFDVIERENDISFLVQRLKKLAVRLKEETPDKFGIDPARMTHIPGYNILSQREIEVLDQLSRGLSNREVATALEISFRTVETHRSHIFKKLGVKNLVELIQLIYS
jgi:FixJ family two-component response regulator